MKPLRQESLGVFPLSSKTMHVFTRIFGKSKFSKKTEIMLVFVKSKFSKKTKIMLVFVRNKRVLEIQVIPYRCNHTPRKPKKKKTQTP